MPENIVGAIPEFDSDGSAMQGQEEVKPEVIEQERDVTDLGKGTETPPEATAEEVVPPAGEKPKPEIDEYERQLQGLQGERAKLLKEISELKGTRREIKEDALFKVNEKIDDLKDVAPEDITVVEKILRSKGYVTKEDADRMLYDSVKQEELSRFLEKFPEYKPENDPSDVNWSSLQKELAWLKLPQDPHLMSEVLERAHKNVFRPKPITGTDIVAKKRQIEVASVGGGGVQKSSAKGTLSSHQREAYLRGGWSEEDITKIESNL